MSLYTANVVTPATYGWLNNDVDVAVATGFGDFKYTDTSADADFITDVVWNYYMPEEDSYGVGNRWSPNILTHAFVCLIDASSADVCYEFNAELTGALSGLSMTAATLAAVATYMF